MKRASNKKEFRLDTIRISMPRNNIIFQHIKFDTFNNCDVQTEVGDSEWELLKSGVKHFGTGKKWYPDGEHQDVIFEMFTCLGLGQLNAAAANYWVTEFFSHLEVATLGEESIFADSFPEFFKTCNNSIKKIRDRIVKSAIDS